MVKFPGYPCPVCRRAGGEVTISYRDGPLAHVCSQECARIYVQAKGKIDMERFEKDAAAKGGEEAGAYLDQIGKTDLADLTAEQWAEFCQIMFSATCNALRLRASDEIPF